MKLYEVEGNLTSDKSSEAYPVMSLCDECVSNYTVISGQGDGDEFCEDCGCQEDFEDEEE